MERLYRTLECVRRWLGSAAMLVCITLFGASTVLLAVDIGMRYLLRSPMQHVAEIITIAFIYVYLLGAAALYIRNEDIALDLIFRRFGARVQGVWLMAIYMAILLTMIVICVETVKLIGIQRGIKTPSLRLPLAVEHSALAIAAAMIAFSSLVDLMRCWRSWRLGEVPLKAEEEMWPG